MNDTRSLGILTSVTLGAAIAISTTLTLGYVSGIIVALPLLFGGVLIQFTMTPRPVEPRTKYIVIGICSVAILATAGITAAALIAVSAIEAAVL